MSLAATDLPRSSRESIPAVKRGHRRRTLIASMPNSPSPSLYAADVEDDSASQATSLDSPETMFPPQRPTMTMTTTTAGVDGLQAPALPERSARRASRMLDGLTQKMTSEDQPPFPQSAPHELYLSSEEDASSSADDFSDFEYESGSEESRSSSSCRRSSREDTARIVSVVFSGKPSIVNLPRRSISPSSSDSLAQTPLARLRRTSALPVIDRMSICSSASTPVLGGHHPPRSSSIVSPGRLVKQKPQFLSIDPFADKGEQHDADKDNGTELKTPKTPTGMFKRTLSLVRKRSKPALNTHYLNHAAAQSRDNLAALPTPPYHMEQLHEDHEASFAPTEQQRPVTSSASGPITYNEILRSAKRRTQTMPMTPISPMSEPPASPMTPNGTRNRLRHGLSAATKRRSMRA